MDIYLIFIDLKTVLFLFQWYRWKCKFAFCSSWLKVKCLKTCNVSYVVFFFFFKVAWYCSQRTWSFGIGSLEFIEIFFMTLLWWISTYSTCALKSLISNICSVINILFKSTSFLSFFFVYFVYGKFWNPWICQILFFHKYFKKYLWPVL